MILLSFLILLSTAQLIIAPPSMLQPNSTTTMSNSDRKDSAANNQKVSASLVGNLNMSVSTSAQIATSTWDQREFIDLDGYFQNLDQSLSRYCWHVYESAYLSWKTTNTQETSVLTCRSTVAESPCLNAGTYVETNVPQFTPTIIPPCCGQCFIGAQKAQAVFWPTPAPRPDISTLVGADGFT